MGGLVELDVITYDTIVQHGIHILYGATSTDPHVVGFRDSTQVVYRENGFGPHGTLDIGVELPVVTKEGSIYLKILDPFQDYSAIQETKFLKREERGVTASVRQGPTYVRCYHMNSDYRRGTISFEEFWKPAYSDSAGDVTADPTAGERLYGTVLEFPDPRAHLGDFTIQYTLFLRETLHTQLWDYLQEEHTQDDLILTACKTLCPEYIETFFPQFPDIQLRAVIWSASDISNALRAMGYSS